MASLIFDAIETILQLALFAWFIYSCINGKFETSVKLGIMCVIVFLCRIYTLMLK